MRECKVNFNQEPKCYSSPKQSMLKCAHDSHTKSGGEQGFTHHKSVETEHRIERNSTAY